ncbi:LysM peptidoglycan-binding domain-containing protein [Rubrobacter marinus]|uniref:LysM peptidoglycan-binding domain-containing protein n=1 Tax=Rubrobacter marinus TaxID=2653852 RepID=A0A6G8PT27_9ACTN|nr:Gmad2 immunoglobulin-like domain-containing protein [Rubrobacter marinus]QIN77649.1 LysM peptidoglycan-binding domain-containing protein [Rubrobacter marinus]
MAVFPPISVRRPHDIVDHPVGVCGVATGFEGIFAARVRDQDGKELREVSVRAGGTGIRGNFRIGLDLPGRPKTARGSVEVFEYAQDGSGGEASKAVVPVVAFGAALIDGYRGFLQYAVEPGDSLSGLAERFLGDGGRWRAIFQANRDRIEDPDPIFAGQTLRIPQ